jgi:hypothetical protein
MVGSKSARRGLLDCAAGGDGSEDSSGEVTCSEIIVCVGGKLLCPRRER